MHVVFLTRKFPPQTGGMETFSWQLTQQWRDDHTVIARGSTQRDILWVAPALLFHAFRLRHTADAYHLGDAVLAPLAPVIHRLTHKPVIVTVHGLELTYDGAGNWYHKLLNWGFSGVAHFVCVSKFTASLLGKRGIAPERISIISHGVVPLPQLHRASAQQQLATRVNLTANELQKRFTLLTVGRLVKRKGVEWFVRNVLPRILDLHPLYIVTSTGPEREHIQIAVDELKLEHVVQLIGVVDREFLHACYSAADVFVMPNITVPHDVEGFGFVPVEAASAGLPVVASRLEGIVDAIHDGKNGLLYEPSDTAACEALIRQWHDNPEQRRAFGETARTYTRDHFRWEEVYERYHTLFIKITSAR